MGRFQTEKEGINFFQPVFLVDSENPKRTSELVSTPLLSFPNHDSSHWCPHRWLGRFYADAIGWIRGIVSIMFFKFSWCSAWWDYRSFIILIITRATNWKCNLSGLGRRLNEDFIACTISQNLFKKLTCKVSNDLEGRKSQSRELMTIRKRKETTLERLIEYFDLNCNDYSKLLSRLIHEKASILLKPVNRVIHRITLRN